jgi:raffinose/stachyose/melibiose transport system permease protein
MTTRTARTAASAGPGLAARAGRPAARTAKWVFLGVLIVITTVPALWLLLSSFKTTTELFSSPFGLPRQWSFANFTGALQAQPLVTYFRNSVVVAAASTALTIVVATMASYALLHKFRLNSATRVFLFFGLLVPVSAFVTPIFYVVYHLGLYNTVWGIALVYSGITLPTGFLIIKTYMDTIPKEIIESAQIDGASFHTVFFRIVVPLSTPGLATAAIFLAIAAWNELLYANLLSQDQSAQTLQVGIRNFLTSYAANYPQAFAATLMAIAPTVLAYAVLSNRVITGMTAGSLK